jgi:CRISPR-associated endonuclease/helicase Cas3
LDSLWQTIWWTPRANLDPRAGAEDLLSRCRTWFPHAFEADGGALPDGPSFSHAFAGLVTLADWIGSDRRFFPFSEPEDGDRMAVVRVKAREAIAAMGMDFPLASRMDVLKRDPFARIATAGYRPRPAQSAILTLPRDAQGSITILEAETGSGKTEAVLARFVSLFESGLVDGLYFALPTRSAATQMHRRVREAVQRAFSMPPAVVLAVPGYLRVDDASGEKLPRFEVLWPDQDRFRFRGWAAESPKRYLAGCIVVGTIDQILLSSLMVGHAHLRASALLRHLLVVDEVHASDAYMTRILEHVLARHLDAGSHAILLSATLGGESRTRLLHPLARASAPGLADAEVAPYPLLTHRAETEWPLAVASDGDGRIIDVATRPWLSDPDALANETLTAGMRGAKVLVIRNTVNDCVKTQLALERAAAAKSGQHVLFTCAGVAAPHHALFARPDREALDNALEIGMGQKRQEGGCVLVATQTVQQSLDLDADVLFSDLCPADVLLQRLGRLHRHTRPRPNGFATPRAFVIVPRIRDLGVLIGDTGVAKNHHGLGFVYPDLRILEATWRLVEKYSEWHVPAMNRHLVERSLHSSILDEIANQGGARWRAHSNQVVGAQHGHRRQAELNLVDWSRAYGEVSFPALGDGSLIVTRLGEGDRRVRFQVPVAGPFGHEVDELVLRPWWARGVPADINLAEDVSAADGSVRFRFGDARFVYDRLGLRPEKTPLTEIEQDDGP